MGPHPIYLRHSKFGGLAQLARVLAWHARGHRFDSDILHKNKLPSGGFFVLKKIILLYFYTMKRTIGDQLKEYFFLKKKDPEANKGINVKLMHGMNRISIFIFLFAMCVLIYRLLFK